MVSAYRHDPNAVQLQTALLSSCSQLCLSQAGTAEHSNPAVLDCRRRNVLVRLGTQQLSSAAVWMLQPQLQLSACMRPHASAIRAAPTAGFSAAMAASLLTAKLGLVLRWQSPRCSAGSSHEVQPLLRYRWTAVLTQRSKLPVLAPFLSLVACYCNLLGQV